MPVFTCEWFLPVLNSSRQSKCCVSREIIGDIRIRPDLNLPADNEGERAKIVQYFPVYSIIYWSVLNQKFGIFCVFELFFIILSFHFEFSVCPHLTVTEEEEEVDKGVYHVFRILLNNLYETWMFLHVLSYLPVCQFCFLL